MPRLHTVTARTRGNTFDVFTRPENHPSTVVKFGHTKLGEALMVREHKTSWGVHVLREDEHTIFILHCCARLNPRWGYLQNDILGKLAGMLEIHHVYNPTPPPSASAVFLSLRCDWSNLRCGGNPLPGVAPANGAEDALAALMTEAGLEEQAARLRRLKVGPRPPVLSTDVCLSGFPPFCRPGVLIFYRPPLPPRPHVPFLHACR